MARRSSGSILARQRLGAALRSLREDANIRIERAARELECSPAKISRLENGLGPAKALEIRALLDLYGLTNARRRTQLLKWTEQTKAVGWWSDDADLTNADHERYLAVETESTNVRIYATPVLPALLQIPAYAVAQISAARPDLSVTDAQRLADLRIARQAALLDPNLAIRLHAILDEGAVRRVVGDRDIHRTQMTWLANLLDSRQDIDLVVQVLRFTSGVPGGAVSPFTLFAVERSSTEAVAAFVEDNRGDGWVDDSSVLADLQALFDALSAASDPPEATSNFLRGVAA